MNETNTLSLFKIIISIGVVYIHFYGEGWQLPYIINDINSLGDGFIYTITFIGRLAVPSFFIISGYSFFKKDRGNEYLIRKIRSITKLIIIIFIALLISQILFSITDFAKNNNHFRLSTAHTFITNFTRMNTNWYLPSYLFIICIMATFNDVIIKNLNRIITLYIVILVLIALNFITNSDVPINQYYNKLAGASAPLAFLLGAKINSNKALLVSFISSILIVILILTGGIKYNFFWLLQSNHIFIVPLAFSITSIIIRFNKKINIKFDLNKMSLWLFLIHVTSRYLVIDTIDILIVGYKSNILYMHITIFAYVAIAAAITLKGGKNNEFIKKTIKNT